jgi:hypothetical protein
VARRGRSGRSGGGRGPGGPGTSGGPGRRGGSGGRGGGTRGGARGTILHGGPLDGQKAQVPLEDGWFDLFPQPDDPSVPLDPDEVGHRYVAEGHRWVYAGTVTAAQSEAERRDRDEPEGDAGGDAAGE